jgi:hypothetical protein
MSFDASRFVTSRIVSMLIAAAAARSLSEKPGAAGAPD